MYDGYHTAFDVMKEFLILGSELYGKYQIPIIPACNLTRDPKDSIDFEESFNKKIKNHKNLNVNFYIDDCKFLRVWNSPDKYIEHLKCFHSVCSPDFSIATGESGMPFALNIYNKYRNHALAWYLHMKGIKIVPSVGIADKESYEWCFDGYEKGGVVSVCTNGRVKAKASRLEFCEGFKYMCEKLEPTKVIIVGRIPDELNTEISLINFSTRNQRINEKFKR